MKDFKKLFISILLLSFGAMFMNDLMAYTNEVRQSGSSYVWRINDVDQGTTSSLATAINNCMGSGREVHVTTGGTLTSSITVPATNVKLYCHNNTFTRNFSGTGIINTYNGFELYDMILRGGSNGYGIRSSRASNLKFVNIQVYDCPWIGIRVDSRESNPWDYWISNLTVTNCRFENCGSHGLETYSVDGFSISDIVAKNCGECGVLLNQSKNGTVGTVDAYRCNYGGGYAGLRFANSCSNVTASMLYARECGRGYFVLTGSNNCHLNNCQITDCSGIGIWLENVANCTVKAGCTNDGVSVSGSGSWVSVSSSCSGGTSGNVSIQNRATGLYIDGMGRTSNGSNAGQWSGSSSNNQKWTMETSGSNVKFKNVATGIYLDGMGRTSNGSLVGQYSGGGSSNQQWTVETVGSYKKIKNVATGLYIDGMGWSSNGSDLGQYSSGSSNNQQWTITELKSANVSDDAIQDISIAPKIVVAPNPVIDKTIRIQLTGISGITNVKLLNTYGQVVKQKVVSDVNAITMSVPDLASGIYFVQIDNAQIKEVETIVVE